MAMYARRRAYALSFLGGVCSDCGAADELQIDHVDPTTKRFVVLGSKWSIAWQRWHDELERCQLLCHLCHVDKTNADRARRRARHVDEVPF